MKLGLISQVVTSFALGAAAMTLSACAMDAQSGADEETDVVDDTAALSAGVNGGACLGSAYNCKLREVGGNRVLSAAGDESWAVTSAKVLDGNGDAIAVEPKGDLKFNYGQARVMNGALHILAMSTASKSAGWFPLDSVASKSALDKGIGRVKAQDPGEGKMACYEVSNSAPDAGLVDKKVVKDADDAHEKAGDYLPLVRSNGGRYANLAYNVPGLSLGGPSIDIYPAGTKFQRVTVPTQSGRPHLAVHTYVKASDGHFTKPSGTLDFYYGYVVARDGTKRFGWMAAPALVASTHCK
ncbi:MAG: hypothetical protein ABI461_00215 [Polyangiaceae bacterium]